MLQENVGEDGVGFRETFSRKKRLKTDEKRVKMCLLRLYFVFTSCLLIPCSNQTPRTFHLQRYKKGA